MDFCLWLVIGILKVTQKNFKNLFSRKNLKKKNVLFFFLIRRHFEIRMTLIEWIKMSYLSLFRAAMFWICNESLSEFLGIVEVEIESQSEIMAIVGGAEPPKSDGRRRCWLCNILGWFSYRISNKLLWIMCLSWRNSSVCSIVPSWSQGSRYWRIRSFHQKIINQPLK